MTFSVPRYLSINRQITITSVHGPISRPPIHLHASNPSLSGILMAPVIARAWSPVYTSPIPNLVSTSVFIALPCLSSPLIKRYLPSSLHQITTHTQSLTQASCPHALSNTFQSLSWCILGPCALCKKVLMLAGMLNLFRSCISQLAIPDPSIRHRPGHRVQILP